MPDMQLKDAADQVAVYGFTSALGATTRIVFTADRYTTGGRIRAYTITAFVAWISYLGLNPAAIDAHWKIAIIGIASLMADDILRAVINIGQRFLSKPIELVADYFKGKV